jgi:ketosteroid isomerase-like protein
MSGGNVKTVRRMFEAWNTALDDHMVFYADDAVHVTAPDWPEQGTYRGKEAIRELWTYILADHEDSSVELDDAISVDERRVLTSFRWHLRGSQSGVVGSLAAHALWTLDGDIVTRVEYYTDERQARDAAGLSS